MKIIFFGSDDFALAHLKALNNSGHDVVLCVTQPDRPRHRGQKVIMSPIKEYSLEHHIEVFQPENFMDEQVRSELGRFNADLFVVIAYGRILPEGVLQIPKVCAINMHGSLLPKYRGAAPINWAVMNGDRHSGLTVIRMNPKMDAGDIIDQKIIEIQLTDTSQIIRQNMMEAGAPFLLKIIQSIEDGTAVYTHQDEAQVTRAPKLNKAMGLIDWTQSAVNIHNQVRGLQPWPGAYTHLHNKRLKVFNTETIEQESHFAPGSIIEYDSKGMLVSTGKGGLRFKEVQLEGGKRMRADEFLRGARIEVGFRF